MWKIWLSSFVIALALLTFTRSAVAQTRRIEGRIDRLPLFTVVPATQLTVLDAGSKSGTLNSWSGTDLWVDIQYNTPMNSTLHVFAEEYPVGSGCVGTVHHRNGAYTFRVDAGERRQRFDFRWPGQSRPTAGGFKEGYLKVYAQLNEQEAHPRFCLRFNYRARGLLYDNQ